MAARGLGAGYQGMRWIRHEKRLAIYLRDGLACAFCGATIEDGAMLTLDHLTPHVAGGSNHESNLVTCCRRCNSSRGDREYVAFAETVAAYLNHGAKAEDIIAHIGQCLSRPLDVAAAKAIIARRGGFSAALQG